MSYVLTCHQCGHDTSVEDTVHRSDCCEKCDADLKCCLNCRHHDTSASNECKETMADYVYKKDQANFCAYYSPAKKDANATADEIDDAKAKLEALFKN